MRKLFGFGSSTPPPPPPPAKPPAPPAGKGASPAKHGAAGAGPSIVGRWKEPQGSDVTEFAADGTVMEKPASGETIRGRYSLEGGRLKIKLEGAADELVFPVVIGGGTLDMTDPEGHVTRYHRL